MHSNRTACARVVSMLVHRFQMKLMTFFPLPPEGYCHHFSFHEVEDNSNRIPSMNHRPISPFADLRTKSPYSVKHSLRSHVACVITVLTAMTLPVCAAPKRTAKTAPAQGNDMSSSFSLVLTPSKHPFCEISESATVCDKDSPDQSICERALERDHIHALLKPAVCGIPATQDGTRKAPNWELNLDPFLGEPFRHSGAWDQNVGDWPTVDGDDQSRCLAGSADIVMERAFRYGFCDSDKYNVDNALEVTDKTFGLQKADYYLINVVVWKGDAIKSAQVSTVSPLKSTDKLPQSGNLTINDDCRYALTGNSIGDLIKAINSDPKACAKAALANGHLAVFSVDGKTDVKVQGNADQIGAWVNPLTYSVESSFWYSFNHGDHGNRTRQRLLPFSNQYPYRIYGTKKPIGLVAIHVRPPNDSWGMFRELKVKYAVNVTKKTSTPVSDLQGLLGIILNPTSLGFAPKADPDGFYGSTFFNAASPSDLTIAAEVDFPTWQQPGSASGNVSPKGQTELPTQPINEAQHIPFARTGRHAVLSSVVMQVGSNEPESVTGQSNRDGSLGDAPFLYAVESRSGSFVPVALGQTTGTGVHTGKTTQQGKGTTSSGSNAPTTTSQNSTQPAVPTAPTVDCQPIGGSAGQQSPCKFQSTFNDEDLTHWDVSFGVPFHTLSDIQYNQSSGSSIVPKSVTRLNAYGFFDIFPIATDIVTPPAIAWPHAMFGLPISGKVLNKPFFGIGDGIYIKKLLNTIPLQFSFYGGVVYNKEFRQVPGTVGSSNVQGHRVWSGSYGIEIPVKQFKTMLSKKSSNSSSSAKTGSQNTGPSTTQ